MKPESSLQCLKKARHAFPSYFLEVHLDIILPSTPTSSKWYFTSNFPHLNPFLLSTYHMPHPSHSLWSYLPNNIWRNTDARWNNDTRKIFPWWFPVDRCLNECDSCGKVQITWAISDLSTDVCPYYTAFFWSSFMTVDRAFQHSDHPVISNINQQFSKVVCHCKDWSSIPSGFCSGSSDTKTVFVRILLYSAY